MPKCRQVNYNELHLQRNKPSCGSVPDPAVGESAHEKQRKTTQSGQKKKESSGNGKDQSDSAASGAVGARNDSDSQCAAAISVRSGRTGRSCLGRRRKNLCWCVFTQVSDCGRLVDANPNLAGDQTGSSEVGEHCHRYVAVYVQVEYLLLKLLLLSSE